MKVVYVSTLISQKLNNHILNNSKEKPLQSIQKFNRLLCEGIKENEIEVETISAIPMSTNISTKKIWFKKSEI